MHCNTHLSSLSFLTSIIANTMTHAKARWFDIRLGNIVITAVKATKSRMHTDKLSGYMTSPMAESTSNKLARYFVTIFWPRRKKFIFTSLKWASPFDDI